MACSFSEISQVLEVDLDVAKALELREPATSKSLAEDVMLDKPEKLREGNPDVKFLPLILKHKGVATNCLIVIFVKHGHLLWHIMTSIMWRLPEGTSRIKCEACKQ